MSDLARVRELGGLDAWANNTIAASATIAVPELSSVFLLTTSGSNVTVTAVNGDKIRPGRRIVFVASFANANTVTFTNTAAASVTSGLMYTGGSNVTLSAGDDIVLIQHANGGWSKE